MKILQLAILTVCSALAATKSPIIIVPGVLGNQLQAKVNKASFASPNSPLCEQNTDWFTLWFDPEIVIPGYDSCFVDDAKLLYNCSTLTYSNPEGVQIRVPGFGNTSSIEYLDRFSYFVPYFNQFVEHFVKLGYKSGFDLRAAPYDWRFAPYGLETRGYFYKLHQLIEETYLANNKTPVTLVAHSMGGPTSLYFLANVSTPEWKASRIKQFVTLSGVWAGSVKSFVGIVSGDSSDIGRINPLILRIAQRSYQSQVWLLPFPSSVWKKNDIVVSQPSRNYSAYDIQQLFFDLKYTNGWDMLQHIMNISSDFPAPNVTSFCFYGTNSSTPKTLLFKNPGQFPDQQPSFVYGDGDGIVNIHSLEACSTWKQKQQPAVNMQEFPGVSHKSMPSDLAVLKAIELLVLP